MIPLGFKASHRVANRSRPRSGSASRSLPSRPSLLQKAFNFRDPFGISIRQKRKSRIQPSVKENTSFLNGFGVHERPDDLWICFAESEEAFKKEPHKIVQTKKDKDSSFLKRIAKRILIWFCSTLVFVSLFIAAFPMIISTSLGLGAATMAINIMLPGKF